MKTVTELFDDNVKSIALNILLFGPSSTSTPTDPHAQDLLAKRNDIRAALLGDGHFVKFGEELIDATLPPPAANPFLQELMLLAEYDLIINLLYTPGTLAELSMLTSRQEFARKAHVFICDQFNGGLVYHQCVLLQTTSRMRLTEYSYPDDVTACHLLGMAKATVADVQLAKFLSP